MDQKNHHKIPSVSSRNDLNPPFPKGEPLCLPLARCASACAASKKRLGGIL